MAGKRKPKEDYLSLRNVMIAILVVLVFLLLFIRQRPESSIIFLYSGNCAICADVEPEVKQISSQAGMKFYKMRYTEPELTPGLIFIHDDKVLISSYRDAESFRMQLCGFTKIRKACDMAGELE